MPILNRYAYRAEHVCWWCQTPFPAKLKNEVYCKVECGHAHRTNQRRHPGVDVRGR